jgi:hypothetical protein
VDRLIGYAREKFSYYCVTVIHFVCASQLSDRDCTILRVLADATGRIHYIRVSKTRLHQLAWLVSLFNRRSSKFNQATLLAGPPCSTLVAYTPSRQVAFSNCLESNKGFAPRAIFAGPHYLWWPQPQVNNTVLLSNNYFASRMSALVIVLYFVSTRFRTQGFFQVLQLHINIYSEFSFTKVDICAMERCFYIVSKFTSRAAIRTVQGASEHTIVK